MAPVVAMDPLVDFGYLGMPQADEGDHVEEEWGEEHDDYDDDLEWMSHLFELPQFLSTVNNWNHLWIKLNNRHLDNFASFTDLQHKFTAELSLAKLARLAQIRTINRKPRVMHLQCYGYQGTEKNPYIRLSRRSSAWSCRCCGLAFVAILRVGVGNARRY